MNHFRIPLLALGLTGTMSLSAQTVTLPLTPAEWTATDSIRFETYLGRPAVYINTGVAMSRSAAFRNGTLEFDMAALPHSTNLGVGFRAQRADAYEVVFFRPGASGSDQAMQYAPAINSIPAAWQIYHGPGYNAVTTIPREKWIHVRIRVIADSAEVFVGDAAEPALVVARLVLGGNGSKLALWASGFGRGAYFSDIKYTADNTPYTSAVKPLPQGTVIDWRLSEALDATALVPGTLPSLDKLTWDPARAEWPGLVLINRYRKSPGIIPPDDRDSVLHGRVEGSKVVFARTVIESDRDRMRLMHFGYSDNVVIYCNGTPLFSGVNAAYFRTLGEFEPLGDAVYLPLKKGKNEIIFAVTEFFGGWAYSAKLEP